MSKRKSSTQPDDNDTPEQGPSSGDNDVANVDPSSNNNDSDSSNTEDDLVEIVDSFSVDTTIMRRPTRQATLKAKKRINEWLNPSENFICVGSVAIHIGSRENL